MEPLNKKIIWNAISAYFMVFVCITFLLSKNKYLNHSFVKKHVISAFLLHSLLMLTWFIMSYGFFSGIVLAGYSLNTIITAWIFLCIFSGILYGMKMAHEWKTVTLWEMFHKASSGKNLISKNSGENIEESQSSILILSHIPFIGYIIWTRNKDIPHMRDILQLNFLSTLWACLLLILGYTSLANIIMLVYIVWSVAQSISLIVHGSIITLWLDIVPTVEEKYILQKTSLQYVYNSLMKKPFVSFKQLQKSQILARETLMKNDEKELSQSPYKNMIRHSIILGILFIVCLYSLWINSPILILFLFPVSYLIGYSELKTYKMPYIYDVYALLRTIIWKISHIFSWARKLKNTTKSYYFSDCFASQNPISKIHFLSCYSLQLFSWKSSLWSHNNI